MSENLKKRLLRFIDKTKSRGIFWGLNRLYQDILVPTTPLSILINRIVFLPMNIKILLFPRISKNYYFVWDLRVAPITFDFLWGIAIAKCYLKKFKLNKLHVIVVFDKEEIRQEEEDYENSVDLSMRYWRINNLIISVCSMVKDIDFSILTKYEANKIIKNQKRLPTNYYINFPTYIQNKDYKILHDSQYDLDIIEVNDASVKYCKKWLFRKHNKDKLITISLRDYKFLKFRNSKLSEWKKIYLKLKSLKFNVIIIPDSEGISDLEKYFSVDDIFLESKYNNQLRLGIYKIAIVNLFVNGGMSTPCLFSDLPYIVFNLIPSQKKEWTTKLLTERSFKVGERPAFLKKNQYWIWDDDNYKVIKNSLVDFFNTNKIVTKLK